MAGIICLAAQAGPSAEMLLQAHSLVVEVVVGLEEAEVDMLAVLVVAPGAAHHMSTQVSLVGLSRGQRRSSIQQLVLRCRGRLNFQEQVWASRAPPLSYSA
jgi:hypothetical protein